MWILFRLFRSSLKFCQNMDRNFCLSLCLQISACSSQQIRGLPSLRSSLATLSIHQSTETMMVQLRLNTTLQYTCLCSVLNVVYWCMYCVTSDTLQSILVPEASEFSQWEAEGAESGCPVTAVIPVWTNLTTLDMSHNCISTIDSSVVRHAHQT